MADIIKLVQEPEDKERGLYLLTMIDENCHEYDTHVTKARYEVVKLKDEIRKTGIDMSLIDKFEEAVIEYERKDEW